MPVPHSTGIGSKAAFRLRWGPMITGRHLMVFGLPSLPASAVAPEAAVKNRQEWQPVGRALPAESDAEACGTEGSRQAARAQGGMKGQRKLFTAPVRDA